MGLHLISPRYPLNRRSLGRAADAFRTVTLSLSPSLLKMQRRPSGFIRWKTGATPRDTRQPVVCPPDRYGSLAFQRPTTGAGSGFLPPSCIISATALSDRFLLMLEMPECDDQQHPLYSIRVDRATAEALSCFKILFQGLLWVPLRKVPFATVIVSPGFHFSSRRGTGPTVIIHRASLSCFAS